MGGTRTGGTITTVEKGLKTVKNATRNEINVHENLRRMMKIACGWQNIPSS